MAPTEIGENGSPEVVMEQAPAVAAAGPPSEWKRVADVDALDVADGNRLHIHVDGRYVSLIQHEGTVYCLDSICFHAGGPLTLGDIEDIEQQPCLVCPWHYYRVSLKDGSKWYQGAERGEEGKLVAGSWKSVGRRQRVHDVERRPDGIYVRLHLEGSLASDEYACRNECGSRLHGNHLRLRLPDRQREASPGRRSPSAGSSPGRASPPASPLASPKYYGSEDVWPDDIQTVEVERRRSNLEHNSSASERRRSTEQGRLSGPDGR
eukprot:scaffold1.g5342.t1